MTTHCMQTRPGARGDLVAATGLSRPATGSSLNGLYAAAAAGTRRLLAKIVRARTRRAALGELSSLSDRQLMDIGLQRAQLGEVVNSMLSAADRRSDRAGA